MEPKVNYILVGAFVVLLGAMILGAIFWLGKTDYRGIYDRYYVYTRESVAGLSVDSTVKYRGVDVGRVKQVILNPENTEEVRVTLDIVGGTPVKTDTQAVLVTQGLTGLVTLNLTGGSREAPSPDADCRARLSGYQERALVIRSSGRDAGETVVGSRPVDPRGQSERAGPKCCFCAG
jgi:phospholipid/cholesterol/gamma-HCH transport system substrate-binding protein